MDDACTLTYQKLCEYYPLSNRLPLTARVIFGHDFAIYNSPIAPDAKEFPRITMFEVGCEDGDCSDDNPIFSEVHVRLDVWTKSNENNEMFGVSRSIKTALQGMFRLCRISLGQTIWEDDTKIYHKPIDIYLSIETEE